MRVPLLLGLVASLLSGCSKPDPTVQECEQSGGMWVPVSDCPSACEPPAPTAQACETLGEWSCATVCGEVPVCHCPEDRPFWQDGVGCVGTEACPATGDDTGGTDTGGTDTGTPAGDILFHASFEDREPGLYTEAMIAQDFGSDGGWNSGLDEGRVSVVQEEGETFLRVSYPSGAVGTSAGGCQFKVPLDASYDELHVSYRVRFGEGFDFVKGGKLPGLCGGECNTGGEVPTGSDGWSARLMWRSDGDVTQYVYHPAQSGEWGDDFYWDQGGQRSFQPGSWHTVQTRIVMNTPGEEDGVVQSWFDGELALDRAQIRYRDVDTFSIDTLYFSTFFGGSGSTWAPTADETVDFDDVVVSTNRYDR